MNSKTPLARSARSPSEADRSVAFARAARIAAAVILQTTPSSPADQNLRSELKKAHGVNAETSRMTARMVFAYYRWLGEINSASPLESRVREALKIQERFNREPASFSDASLLEKAIPDWTQRFMPSSAAWVRAIQSEPVLWLRARPGLTEEFLIQPHFTAGPIPDSLSYSGEADLFTSAGFQNGDFEIQDIASQIVGRLCSPNHGETWWDACAGEGGKTLHLSALMDNKGLIWASDRAEWRLKRLKQRAARAKAFNYRAALWDGSERLPTKTLFDGVLVDAPCSGIGTWQRNPHQRWTIQPEELHELAALQLRLLTAAARGVKRGGRLIYSVCTLADDETTGVTRRFVSDHAEFVAEKFREPFGVSGTEVWLWPQEWRGNGMFIAQWRRAK